MVFWFHVGTVPVKPLYGADVAAIEPLPDVRIEQPVAHVIVATVFVPVVIPPKVTVPGFCHEAVAPVRDTRT